MSQHRSMMGAGMKEHFTLTESITGLWYFILTRSTAMTSWGNLLLQCPERWTMHCESRLNTHVPSCSYCTYPSIVSNLFLCSWLNTSSHYHQLRFPFPVQPAPLQLDAQLFTALESSIVKQMFALNMCINWKIKQIIEVSVSNHILVTSSLLRFSYSLSPQPLLNVKKYLSQTSARKTTN